MNNWKEVVYTPNYVLYVTNKKTYRSYQSHTERQHDEKAFWAYLHMFRFLRNLELIKVHGDPIGSRWYYEEQTSYIYLKLEI